MSTDIMHPTRVVRVTSLVDFCAEVPPTPTHRQGDSSPIARISNTRLEGQRSALLTLSLQAVNPHGEIVWLAEAHHASWLYGKPFGPEAESLHAGMGDLERLVRDWLAAQGYVIRAGDYGLPDNIKPLAAQFECARWVKDEATQTYRVEAAGETAVVPAELGD